MRYSGSITDVEGILIGESTDVENMTGCTVILCKDGATCGVDVRGAAPGTRETDLLRSENLVDRVHAVVLSGGSAFGLESACGTMDYLRDNGYGLDTGYSKIPIVPAAVLYDCNVGNPLSYPNKTMGYTACENATDSYTSNGKFGAGTGATVGKALGLEYCQGGGIGTASITHSSGLVVGSVTAVNALGDIIENDGSIVAGAIKDNKHIDIHKALLSVDNSFGLLGANTTIGVLATNAKLSKTQANRLATICQDALAIAIRPSHTINDGDTYFAMANGETEADFTVLSTLAVECVRRSIINAVSEGK